MTPVALHFAPRVGWPWILVLVGDLRGWGFRDGRSRRFVYVSAGLRRSPAGARSYLGVA